MKRLSVIGFEPPVAVAIAFAVTNPSRELAAAARLGTESTDSPLILMFRCQPSVEVLSYICGAMVTGSADARGVACAPAATTAAAVSAKTDFRVSFTA